MNKSENPCCEQVSLTSKLEELVDQLAENTHNIWARERILQGWTYGLNEDPDMHRSPHLVSYGNVDDAIKKANRDTASETIRTLLVYGYILEAPTGDQAEGERQPAWYNTSCTTLTRDRKGLWEIILSSCMRHHVSLDLNGELNLNICHIVWM